MDVVNVQHAQIAQEAGAVAVMALERVPADIRKQGGVARMSDPGLVKAIKEAVTIPVMAKARIGHFVEAQILQALKIDYIDESGSVRLPPMKIAISTKASLRFLSCVAPAIWARRCGGSLKARR